MRGKPSTARAYIGTSGYQYNHWRGVFYPKKLNTKQWFEYYARHFDTVEINHTFYHLPEASAFDQWKRNAPADFTYALKFSRYGSHMKCLKDPEQTIGAFLDRAERLGPRLGPILVQLKPRWKADAGRLRAFLEAAPKKRRWTVEFRDSSWLCNDIFDILREHGAALCIHDMLDDHPREITADWVYLRFHGDHYTGRYSPQYLTARAKDIAEHLEAGRDVFAYFNNDAEGHAVRNALELTRYVRK